jgi:hypothetical protein
MGISSLRSDGAGLGWIDWTTLNEVINTDFLINDKHAAIAPYISKSAQVFKCPADNFLSAPERSARIETACTEHFGKHRHRRGECGTQWRTVEHYL